MIKAEQIPPDAMYAAWKALNAGMTLTEAIAAAINAWPGTEEARSPRLDCQIIILPLTQENNNGSD